MSERYTGSKWGIPGLGNAGGQVTWSFASVTSIMLSFDQSITAAPFQASIRAAFDLWERVANIDFVEVADNMSSDIRLGWDYYDGAGGTLAKAMWQFYGALTSYSEIGFDLGDVWRASVSAGPSGNDFFAVAVHEIGHAIGLSHTDEQTSIMYPYLGPQSGLSTSDVQAIQALYGAAVPAAVTSPVPPLPTPPAVQTDQADLIAGKDGDEVISALFGNDTVDGGAGNDVIFGNQDADLIHGGIGLDTIFGGKDDDIAYGDAGDDQLFGNMGEDQLYGSSGYDFLHGGQGDDRLFGGLADDTVNGGVGNDILTGGTGSDRFVFSAGQGADVIADFSFLEGDQLDLQGQAFAVASAGADTMLTLSGGGSIRLLGVTAFEFDAFAVV